MLKRGLRAERWNCDDAVLWQPEKGGPYRIAHAEEAAALEDGRGRSANVSRCTLVGAAGRFVAVVRSPVRARVHRELCWPGAHRLPRSAAAAAPDAGSASGSPTWTTYFYPLKVGWTCQEALTTVTTGNETLTVAAVSKTKAGRR